MFIQVRLWNRTFEKAKALCAELGAWAKAFESNEMCVRGADVIVTATYATEPIVKAEWLTPGVHINGTYKQCGIHYYNLYNAALHYLDICSNQSIVLCRLHRTYFYCITKTVLRCHSRPIGGGEADFSATMQTVNTNTAFYANATAVIFTCTTHPAFSVIRCYKS